MRRTTRLLAVLLMTCVLAGAATQLTSVAADERKEAAFKIIDKNAMQLALISDLVLSFSQPDMQDFENPYFLKGLLETADFTVELGSAGVPAHLWAKWGNGKPTILIASEINARPAQPQTPGLLPRQSMVEDTPIQERYRHTQASVALGAAYALRKVMEQYKLPGTIMLSLAEGEQPASRPFLVRAGYLKDVDAGLIAHVSDRFSTGWGPQNYAAISAVFTFRGRTAHGGVNPWDGKDAGDAVELMNMGFDKLREHLRPSYRAHRTILNGGVQPNIIPDLGRVWWFVRDASAKAAQDNFDKLVKIGEGAALMTGTTMEPPHVIASAWPSLGNHPLSEALRKNMEAINRSASGPWAPNSVSSDIGDYTWNAPFGLMTFPVGLPDKSIVVAAKVMAGTALDMLTSPEFLQKAKDGFAEDTKETKYFSLLPEDAKPQLVPTNEASEQLRSEMAELYRRIMPKFE